SRHYQKGIHQSLQRFDDYGSAHRVNDFSGNQIRVYQRYNAVHVTTSRNTRQVFQELLRNDLPYFAETIENITVAMGRDAIFPCVVNNLTNYKVAWLKEETHSLLSIHDKLITRNYRISLSEAMDKRWTLRISSVQESDTGWYMCQINTVPMLSQKAYLHVVGKCKRYGSLLTFKAFR
ncbi:zwei Ig domain protein zig-8-like, partial [Artemia franciscana]|uniref:zwei Ig domain protein zig-8-like n=1 Tax=Artemia franciscana TaxID=6661 RepID=UPI0032DA9D06